MNVDGSGEACTVDNDWRTEFSFQTHVHIYAYINQEALYLTVCVRFCWVYVVLISHPWYFVLCTKPGDSSMFET